MGRASKPYQSTAINQKIQFFTFSSTKSSQFTKFDAFLASIYPKAAVA
jgi:hypothetical protein